MHPQLRSWHLAMRFPFHRPHWRRVSGRGPFISCFRCFSIRGTCNLKCAKLRPCHFLASSSSNRVLNFAPLGPVGQCTTSSPQLRFQDRSPSYTAQETVDMFCDQLPSSSPPRSPTQHPTFCPDQTVWACRAANLQPALDLAWVVLASPPLKEAAVPLEPAIPHAAAASCARCAASISETPVDLIRRI